MIGHEIIHGFDTSGKQYDSLGNLVNWWKPKTEEKFKKRAQCMVWQYGNYTVKQVNMKIDGILTQGENIGDNGGIHEAYLAYGNYHISYLTFKFSKKKIKSSLIGMWEKDNDAEKGLPGLPYTSKELFWIAIAQVISQIPAARKKFSYFLILQSDII